MESISKSDLVKLNEEIIQTIESLDIPTKKLKAGELENETLKESFWSDNNKAKKVMSELEHIKKEIETANKLMSDSSTLLELFTQSDEQDQLSLLPDIKDLQERFSKFQINKFLSGKYDFGGAILTVHAGQGGTEANDWAQMLFRMYVRYSQREGWKEEVINIVPGTETGISSATLEITGDFAFGKLKRESGAHRLVRLSPFNAQNLRQTSFAKVEVIPLIDDSETEIDIPSEEIEFKAVRAGGAGGQNVNKTSSAVQIKHIPTGLTAQCSARSDQYQNRQTAMQILKAKIWQLEEEKREKEIQKIKGEHKIASWGNQIRNYVLHPYKLVKDLRTGVESTDPFSVLDGEIHNFVDAEIRIG